MFQKIIAASLTWIQRIRRYFIRSRDSLLAGRKKKDGQLAVSLLFSAAFIAGVCIKLALSFFVTIGYDDYHSVGTRNALSLIELQEKTLKGGGSLAYIPKQSSGPVCTDSK